MFRVIYLGQISLILPNICQRTAPARVRLIAILRHGIADGKQMPSLPTFLTQSNGSLTASSKLTQKSLLKNQKHIHGPMPRVMTSAMAKTQFHEISSKSGGILSIPNRKGMMTDYANDRGRPRNCHDHPQHEGRSINYKRCYDWGRRKWRQVFYGKFWLFI